jgi:hypothetical protein
VQVPLFGLGNAARSTNASAQTRLNLYVERLGEQDKSAQALYARPGLARLTVSALSGGAVTSGTPSPGVILGPVRGMDVNYTATGYSSIFGVLGNVLFQWQGGVLYLAWANYLTSTPFTTSSGRVSVVNDGINVVVADGVGGYYAPSGVPSGMQPIADADFPATTSWLAVVASHVIAGNPTYAGRFQWSAAGDATSWDPLDFATAESCPDPLTYGMESNGELLLFGPSTLEFWAPTGDTTVFARIGSTGAQWGTTAVDTIKRVGNRVMFVGRQPTGGYQVALLEGYSPRVVSDAKVEDDIASIAGGADGATANVVTWRGHTFYVLNLPTKSWAYDVTTGSWSVWKTDDTRFAGNYQVQFADKTVVSDWRDQRLYYLSDVYTDDGRTLVREVTSRHIFNDLKRVSCWNLTVDAEVGVGTSTYTDPQAMLQISKDGGHSWGVELWTTLGAMGDYLKRLVWRRLGVSRDWLFKLRVTEPVKVVWIGAYGDFDSEQ